jgi:serine/threonine protein phosphatase 1
MKRFVIGDIHGAHKALLQCFERSNFNYEEDELISLGDVADGWNEVPEVFDELLKVKKLIYIIGNHDEWLRKWFKFGQTPAIWTRQGGQATIDAYNRILETKDISSYVKWRRRHEKLLDKAKSFYHVIEVEENIAWRKLFVHGGFNWQYPIESQDLHDLMWDRHMWQTAIYWQRQHDKGIALDKIPGYDEIFIGHTSTSRFDKTLKPVHLSNVWNLDQGAGWAGKLTIMNIDTKEYWQSDLVSSLYPDVKGRK